MKNENIIPIIIFGLFGLSLYLSVVTDFPYIIYFFIVTPILLFVSIKLYFVLGFHNRKRKKEHEKYLKLQAERENRIELEKKRIQQEWDSLPQVEKDKILKENKRKEKLQADKVWKEYQQRMLDKKNAEKLAEEKRLNDIRIKEENENQERLRRELLAQEKEAKQQELAEKRTILLQEQKEKREVQQKEAIKRKILENERRKQLESEVIQELLDAGLIDNNHYTGKNIRESIPTEVKIAVWQRDKERCVSCYNNTNLEFDHIIPVSKGGANSIKNIQLLCRNCNRTKSNKIV